MTQHTQLKLSLIFLAFGAALAALGAPLAVADVDCSNAYNGQAATCTQVECSEKFKSFLGTWIGPMETFDKERNAFRPYTNKVTYDRSDCLKNAANGEVFIVGHRTDVYPAVLGPDGATIRPAETKTGLLITGTDALGRKFLRTVDSDNGMINYEHVFSDEASETAIWRYNWPGNATSAPMVFTIIDGRDMTEPAVHKRLVTFSLAGPGWSAIGSKGYHILTPR